jgi:hypothetical protein
MELEIASSEVERVKRAFMGRIARIVLPENGSIDRRDALVLIGADIIRSEPVVDSEGAVDRLRQAAVDEGAGVPFGPLLFYVGREGGHSVVRVRDLLLDSRQEVRAAAATRLEKTLKLPGLSCRRTRQGFERLRSALLASEDGGWRRAAIALVDAVDDDWLLNVAGVVQSQGRALSEVWSGYVTAALRPSLASVHACSPPTLCTELHGESIDERLRSWQSEHRSPLALTQVYVDELGHLPPVGDRSLGAALSIINSDRSSEGEWEAILDWAENAGSPFARCHVCEAILSLLAGPALQRHPRAAIWFWETALAPKHWEARSSSSVACTLAAQLARYYLHYLEVRLPSDNGAAITAMAWWMTKRMMMAIGDEAERQRSFGTQLAAFYGSTAAEVWELVAPPTAPSYFRWLTAFGPCPWALSLLAAVRSEEDAHWLLSGTGPGTQEERQQAVIAIAMQVANVDLNQDGQPYRVTAGPRRVLGWIAAREPDEERRRMLTGWSKPVDWSESDSLAKSLERINERDEITQRWTCHSIRQRVSVGALSGDDLWAIVSSDHWRAAVWPTLDRVAAQAIGCALVDDALRRRPEWTPQLAHLFAQGAERRSESESDRQAFFGLVLRSSCSLDSRSAMCRLLRGPAGHRFRPLAAVVRGNLEQVLPQAGGWAAGRLRASLVDLLQ